MSEDLDKKLEQWVANDTWHTGHPNDMNRFYQFVDAYTYIKSNGLAINDEAILAEKIAQQARIKTIDPRFKTIKDRVSSMYDIIDFLKATSRN